MTALLPPVQAFLARTPLKLYVNGAWRDAASGRTFDVRDPGDGRVVAQAAAGEAPDIDDALVDFPLTTGVRL